MISSSFLGPIYDVVKLRKSLLSMDFLRRSSFHYNRSTFVSLFIINASILDPIYAVIHLTKLEWTLGIAPVFFIHKPSTFGPLFINSSSFSSPSKPGPAHKHFILHAPRTMGPYFVNGAFDIATISVPHCAREVLSNLRKNYARHPAKAID
jgi:hypothetical protein